MYEKNTYIIGIPISQRRPYTDQMTKKRVQCSYARVLIHVDACFKGSVRLFRVGNLICIEWCTNLSRDIIALNIALTHNTGTFQRSMQEAKAKVSIEVKTGGSGKPKSTKGPKGALKGQSPLGVHQEHRVLRLQLNGFQVVKAGRERHGERARLNPYLPCPSHQLFNLFLIFFTRKIPLI